jgi:hypothetical protein
MTGQARIVLIWLLSGQNITVLSGKISVGVGRKLPTYVFKCKLLEITIGKIVNM